MASLITDSTPTIVPKLIFGDTTPLPGYVTDQHENDNFIKKNALNAEKFNEFERLLNAIAQQLGDVTTGFDSKTIGTNIRIIQQTLADSGTGGSSSVVSPFQFWLLGGNVFTDPENTIADNTTERRANTFDISFTGGLDTEFKTGIGIVGDQKLNAEIIEVSQYDTSEFTVAKPGGTEGGIADIENAVIGDDVNLDSSNPQADSPSWSNGELHSISSGQATLTLENKYLVSNVFTNVTKTVVAFVDGVPDKHYLDGVDFTVDAETGIITLPVGFRTSIGAEGGSPVNVRFYYVHWLYRRDLVVLRERNEAKNKIHIINGTSQRLLSLCDTPSYSTIDERPLYEIILYPNNTLSELAYDTPALSYDNNVVDLRIDVNTSNEKWKAARNGIIKEIYSSPVIVDDREQDTLVISVNQDVVLVDGRLVVTKEASFTLVPDPVNYRIAMIVSDQVGTLSLSYGGLDGLPSSSPFSWPTLPTLADGTAFVRMIIIKPAITDAILDDTIYQKSIEIFKYEHRITSDFEAIYAHALYEGEYIQRATITGAVSSWVSREDERGGFGNPSESITLDDFLDNQLQSLPGNIKRLYATQNRNYAGSVTIPQNCELIIEEGVILTLTSGSFTMNDGSIITGMDIDSSIVVSSGSITINEYCNITNVNLSAGEIYVKDGSTINNIGLTFNTLHFGSFASSIGTRGTIRFIDELSMTRNIRVYEYSEISIMDDLSSPNTGTINIYDNASLKFDFDCGMNISIGNGSKLSSINTGTFRAALDTISGATVDGVYINIELKNGYDASGGLAYAINCDKINNSRIEASVNSSGIAYGTIFKGGTGRNNTLIFKDFSTSLLSLQSGDISKRIVFDSIDSGKLEIYAIRHLYYYFSSCTNVVVNGVIEGEPVMFQGDIDHE